jgi:hypothetical protein
VTSLALHSEMDRTHIFLQVLVIVNWIIYVTSLFLHSEMDRTHIFLQVLVRVQLDNLCDFFILTL